MVRAAATAATTLALTIDMPELSRSVSWNALEALVVQMGKDVPRLALAQALDEAQERLIDGVCGPRWAPVRHRPAPFRCPRCQAGEDFARKGRRSRPRVLHTAAGRVELILWHVGCRSCGRVFAPLLLMLGLEGKRRTDRLTVDLAELGTQMSFARAARIDRELAGTAATAGQAHGALADVAAILAPEGELGPAHTSPDVVLLDAHRGPGRPAQERGRGEPGDRADRPVRAARAAPGHLPPAGSDGGPGLVDDGPPAGRDGRPGAGRRRRRDRHHHAGATTVAADADPALLVAPAARTAPGPLRR